MPRRPLARGGTGLSRRITVLEIARAHLFDVDVDRKKRIDDAIDYFGAGAIDISREGVRQLRLAFKTTRHGRATRFRRACRVRPRGER